MKFVALLALIGVLSAVAKNSLSRDNFDALISKHAHIEKDTTLRPKHESAPLKRRRDVTKMARVQANTNHQVIIALKQSNLDELKKLVYDLADPNSSNFGNHLSKEEVLKMTANPKSANHVKKFLKAHGVKIVKSTVGQEYITAEAPVSKWEELLQTEFFHYDVQGETRQFARAAHYSIPAALEAHVASVFRVADFPTPVAMRNPASVRKITEEDYAKKAAHTSGAALSATMPTCKMGKKPAISGVVCPAVINAYYGVHSNQGNQQTTQAIFASLNQSMSPSDLSDFQTNFNIPQQAISQDIGGHSFDAACNANPNNCIEANLDVQYMMSVSQVTNTTFYYTDLDWVPWITEVANMANPPKLFSISYGGPEDGYTPSQITQFNTEALKLAAMGTTIIVASGDDGALSYYARNVGEFCGYYPDFPGASPYVTAVGATQGAEIGVPEIPQQSQLGGGITTGGGFSNLVGPQSWQSDALAGYFNQMQAQGITYGPGVNMQNRGYPDVALAGHAYVINAAGTYYEVDGTSASAPTFAGMVSLINAARIAAGKSTLGWLNPALYQLKNSIILNDPSTGINNCAAGATTCCAQGYYAAPGWDPLTGIGSVNFTRFMNVFSEIGNQPNIPTKSPVPAPGAPTADPTIMPTAEPTAAPTARPTLSSQGWFYSNLFQDMGCTGIKYAQYGSPVGLCTPRYDSDGTIQGSEMTTCNGDYAFFASYASGNCDPATLVLTRKVWLNICDVLSSDNTTSASFQCSTQGYDYIPLSNDQWVLQYEYDWHVDHSCTNQPNYFTAFKNNYCIKQSDSKSTFVNFPNATIYANNGACSGTHGKRINLHTQCQIVGVDDDASILQDDGAGDDTGDDYAEDLSYAAVASLVDTTGNTMPPTAKPTMKPTMSPVSSRPTPMPSVNDLINFAATQVISGISYATYNSDQTLYASTLKTSIALCMPGLTASNIVNLVVNPTPASSAESLRRMLQTGNSISTVYEVALRSTTTSYETLSSQLTQAVTSGQFDTNLHTTASQTGATGYSTATSTSVTTQDLTATTSNDDSDDEVLSTGAIIGIAIGGFFGLLLIVGLVWYCTCGKKNSDGLLSEH